MQYNSRQFQEHFRMSSEIFSTTLALTSPLLCNRYGTGRPTISPQKQFLSVLWLLATPDSYRSVADRFGMSKSSLYHSFIRMIHVLNPIAPETIKWPRSAIDIENIVNGFRRSDHPENHPERFFPNDEFIIGDKAYPVRRWCITPYINRGHLTLKQRHFNTTLTKVRQSIERAFALLKGRFRRLKYLDMSRIDLIPATILACCVLHNLCLNNSDDELENYIMEGMFENNIDQQNAGDEDSFQMK